MRRLTTWFGLVALLSLMLGTGPARAQIIVYLTDGNTALKSSNFSGPFAKVTLTPDPGINGFDVAVQALAGTGTKTESGSALIDHFGFNIPSPGVSSSNVTDISPRGYVYAQDYGKSGIPFNGFGKFTNLVGANNNPGGSSQNVRTQDISFHIAGIGTSPSVFGLNSNPAQFAVKWYSSSTSTATTGFAAAVPEPGPFVGAGVVTLMGLGYTWRRRRRATV